MAGDRFISHNLANLKYIIPCGAMLIWSANSADQAHAQAATSSAPAENGALSLFSDDIIVTARRREERLQEVPLAVTAITAKEFREKNLNDVESLTRAVPSLAIVPTLSGSRSTPTYAIRGMSQQEILLLSDQSVSIYQGDIVAARPQGTNAILFDLANVEILRGPQGTLFGRNTTGGAVILRPMRPTDEWEASAEATYGSRDMINLRAMVNIPVSDILSIRLAGATRNDDGFVRDIHLDRKINGRDQEAGRASIELKSPAGTSSLTVYNYFHEDSGATPSFIKHINPDGSLNSPTVQALRGYRDLRDILPEQQARGIYTVTNGTPGFDRVTTHDVANTTVIPINDSIQIKNIIGYRHVKAHSLVDFDGTENSMFAIEREVRTSQFSEEFQVLGDSGRMSWIAGAYYFWEHGRDPSASLVGGVDPGPIEHDSIYDYPATPAVSTDAEARNQSIGLFAQGTYRFGGGLEGLSLTLGARYNKDKREAIIRNHTGSTCRFTRDLDNNPATPEVPVPLSLCRVDLSKSFSEPTYNISLEYKVTNDKLIYLAHRHGYRTGGFSARASTEAGLRVPFQPELVDDIELGFKGDWRLGDTFLRTNVAVYYADYQDIQRSQIDASGISPVSIPTNAEKARIWGVEGEFLFRPIPQVDLSGSYAHTNAKFVRFIALDGTDLSSTPISRAPRNVYTVGARVRPIDSDAAGTISMGVSYYHTDGYSATDDLSPANYVHGYGLLNADIGWENVMGSKFGLTIFGTNLLKKKYSLLFSDLQGLGFTSHTPGEPRTFGVTLRYRFGS